MHLLAELDMLCGHIFFCIFDWLFLRKCLIL